MTELSEKSLPQISPFLLLLLSGSLLVAGCILTLAGNKFLPLWLSPTLAIILVLCGFFFMVRSLLVGYEYILTEEGMKILRFFAFPGLSGSFFSHTVLKLRYSEKSLLLPVKEAEKFSGGIRLPKKALCYVACPREVRLGFLLVLQKNRRQRGYILDISPAFAGEWNRRRQLTGDME